MGSSWQIATIRGIPIRLHWSLLLVFALLSVSLATAYLPGSEPELDTGSAWGLAIVASVLFFVSLLLHELGHSIVAMRAGLPVDSITLFIFGGIARIRDEAKSAETELRIAAAGPLVSLALAAVFGLVWLIVRGSDALAAAAFWLAIINLVLALFNLLPGFPLDGGRVLRALVWQYTGSQQRATQVALISGQFVAFGLMGIGALLALAGNFTNGAWLIFIGWFLQNAAATEAQGSTMRNALEGATVGQAMGPREPVVASRMKLRQLVEEYVLTRGERYFLVADDGNPRGIVTLKDVTAIDRDRWDWTSVADIMKPWGTLSRVTPDMPLLDAMRLMDEKQVAQLPVVEGDRPIGLLTREEVIRFTRLRLEMEDVRREAADRSAGSSR
jgi:Zn-dependent protease/CBS domain-containing protein